MSLFPSGAGVAAELKGGCDSFTFNYMDHRYILSCQCSVAFMLLPLLQFFINVSRKRVFSPLLLHFSLYFGLLTFERASNVT